MRGEAYLRLRNGEKAATEFQKIVDHRSVVVNSVWGALAHVQLGRAYAMAGETAKAKAAYQDFLTLWKDADPDIPNPEASQSGVREAPIAVLFCNDPFSSSPTPF